MVISESVARVEYCHLKKITLAQNYSVGFKHCIAGLEIILALTQASVKTSWASTSLMLHLLDTRSVAIAVKIKFLSLALGFLCSADWRWK